MSSVATYRRLDGSRRANASEYVVDSIDLKAAIRGWGEVNYTPLDVAVLDPPEVCERCGQSISGDDFLDYVDAEDGSLMIVHEHCHAAD